MQEPLQVSVFLAFPRVISAISSKLAVFHQCISGAQELLERGVWHPNTPGQCSALNAWAYKFGYQSRSGTGQSSLSLCFLGEAVLAKSFSWLDGHSSRIMSSFGKSLKHRELPVLHVRVFLSRTLTWDKDHACDLLSSVMSFVVLLFCCVFLMENMLLSTDWKISSY
jgi:hypothetical protein